VRRMPRKPMGSSSVHAAVNAMAYLRRRQTAAGHRLLNKNVACAAQFLYGLGEKGKGGQVVLKRIVDKCNFGLEGPSATEKSLPIPPLPEDEAKIVADIINRAEGPNSSRFYAVVDLDYKLWKFEV